MKLRATLVRGGTEDVIDTVSLPDVNKKGCAIPGAEHIVASRVREVLVSLEFKAIVTEKERDQLFNDLRNGRGKVFTIEEST